jgi:hypothetical protein
MARGMRTKTTHAGGCFLMIAILLGFLGGLSVRDPLLGTLIGTGIGVAIAAIVWLIDRRHA